jgi:integrase/recombinase XerD
MATVKIIRKLNKIDADKKAPLYLRIIKDRKTKFVSLGIKLKEDEWDPQKSLVKKKHPNSQRLNNYIAHKVAEAQGIALEMETNSKYVSPRSIKENILGRSSQSFIQYYKNYLESLLKNGKLGTHDKANAVYSKLCTYLNNKDLTFDELTVTFLKNYETYLADELGNSVNTIHSNLKIFRKLINDAINEDIFPPEKNPFLKFKLKLEKTTKEFLTEEEIKKLEELQFPENSMMNNHRNIYVFATYAGGLRISDILQLRWHQFDGERILMTTQKTKNVVSVKLPSKALDIINSYKSEEVKPTDFIFPFLKNDIDYSDKKVLFDAISSHTAYTNKDLKKIAKLAEIDKAIHFHTSRHTFATRALKKGMRIEYVSKLLGHNSIKTTQVYAKIVNNDLDNAMDEFFSD